MSSRDNAVHLLDHYVTLTMRKAGLTVDSDTHAELAEIVDQIVAAAVEAVHADFTDRVKAVLNQQVRAAMISGKASS